MTKHTVHLSSWSRLWLSQCVDEGKFNSPEGGHGVAGSSWLFVAGFDQIMLVIKVGVLNCPIGEFLK